MSARISNHLRSNVVGYVALFFSLGLGTAWAIDANSVKSKHIKDGQVRTDDVADDTGTHALTGTDVAANSLSGADIDDSSLFGDNSLNGADIDEGSLYNDNSLDGGDVDESALYNDNSLTGADVDESTLSGVNAAMVDGADLCAGTLRVLTGEQRTLCQEGTLTLTGSCAANNDPRATAEIDTSADNAFYAVMDGGTPVVEPDFDDADATDQFLSVEDAIVDASGVGNEPVTFHASEDGGTGRQHMAGTMGVRVTKTANAVGHCDFVALISH